MCLIAISKNGPLPTEFLLSASDCNPDGIGVACLLPDGQWLVRRAMAIEDLCIDDLHRYALQVWHFRIATSGDIDLRNCHPLTVSPEAPSGLAEEIGADFLFHSGVLRSPRDKSLSDTAVLAKILSFLPEEQRLELLDIIPGQFVLTHQGGFHMKGNFSRVGGFFVSLAGGAYEIARWQYRHQTLDWR